MMVRDVAVVDQDLDAVGDFVFVAHGGARRAANRVEDVRVEDVEAAAFQLAVHIPRLLDHLVHQSGLVGLDDEVALHHLRVGLVHAHEVRVDLAGQHLVAERAQRRFQVKVDVAEHQQERQLDARFQRANRVREAERAFLFDEGDADAVARAVAEVARHLVAEMPDDDVDVGDAAVAHHFDLVGEQRAIQDRQDRLRAALRERIHARALAGGEDHADHLAVEAASHGPHSPLFRP